MADEGRKTYLLREAAKSLERAEAPFTGEWLREHKVTSEEVVDVATLVAMGCRLMLVIPQMPVHGGPLMAASVLDEAVNG